MTIKTVTSVPIESVEDYVICPARAYMNLTLPEKPAKQTVLALARKGLYDVILSSLGQERLNQQTIEKVCSEISSTPGYVNADYDYTYLTELFINLDNLLVQNEYTITGGVMPFEFAYSGFIVKSAIDFVVKDNKRGYISPALLDFSRTRYEPAYNPIVYRCQTVVDHMQLGNHNTDVIVFTPYSNKAKKWSYEKTRMSQTVKVAIEEICQSMKQGYFYHRIGWWCAGCPYRGICFKIMEKRK